MSPKQHVMQIDDSSYEGPLLQVNNLKTYFSTSHGIVRAVDGVSFTLERGRSLGLVGESGSGKTVLSRSIMGLLPPHNVVREGTVHFAGVELSSAPLDKLRDLWGVQISMVFQDPMTALNPVVRVGRQITESLRYHLAMDRADAQATAVALLKSVGLPEPEERLRWYPHQFSGGMCQRIVIAVALACGPKLVLADEPTTGLDVTVSAQILDLLSRLQQERFMSMIMVTHDLGVVSGRCDDTAVVYAGKIVEMGPTAVLFRDMKMPYTEALLRSTPRLSNASHTRLPTIPGNPPNPAHYPGGCRFAPRCEYAQPRCRAEEPPLKQASPGHVYACWYPVGTPEGRDAHERNEKVGLAPATTGGSF
ncbi:MAG TPA: ABC transporter ATP-binding protein [Acidimicrobiales bacterium]|nr:ABC transporter ATP-binding protein [Acidimicrobiales bacterium]